jgi:hypothetical protein
MLGRRKPAGYLLSCANGQFLVEHAGRDESRSRKGRKCSTLSAERAVTSATALAERRSRRRVYLGSGRWQLVLRRQPRPVGDGDHGSAVRRPPGDLGHGHQPRLRIRPPTMIVSWCMSVL